MVFLLNWDKGWGFKYPEERRFGIFELAFNWLIWVNFGVWLENRFGKITLKFDQPINLQRFSNAIFSDFKNHKI